MAINTTTPASDTTDNDGYRLFALLFACSFVANLMAAEAINKATNLGDSLLAVAFLGTMVIHALTLFPVLEKKIALTCIQVAWIAVGLAVTAGVSAWHHP